MGEASGFPSGTNLKKSTPHRNEVEHAVPSLGQTSTPTREELAAWLIALTLPIRSTYATDNKSVVGKATKIIEVAIKHESNVREGKRTPDKNPLGKAWGLQTDGDLWQQAWEAVVKRGACNQTIRWVKGHATDEDVKAGRTTQKDKHGNQKNDDYANKGVENIKGVGLVCLAEWMANRHARYGKLMRRIQKFIAGILMAEKEERKKDKQVEKALLGYDPTNG